MAEFTGWWQGSQDRADGPMPMQALDGIYWPPRRDLGGLAALKQAISIAQTELGRRVCLYVCAAEVANISGAGTLFTSSAQIQDWASITPPASAAPDCPSCHGQERPGEPGMVRMCRGYGAWQAQVTAFVTRILRELAPDCIRLDCVKAPSENCYNPAHNHSSPFGTIRWNYELVRAVRQGMDRVDPDALLMTEGLHEVYWAAGAGGGLAEPYSGTAIPPMRVALPGYWFTAWGGGGAIESGTNGFVPQSPRTLRREFPYADCDRDFYPCAGAYKCAYLSVCLSAVLRQDLLSSSQ